MIAHVGVDLEHRHLRGLNSRIRRLVRSLGLLGVLELNLLHQLDTGVQLAR